MEKNIEQLDKIDRKLLFELDKNCRMSTIKLAKTIKKSRQTVEYRINQLVKKGIITKFQTAINPHKIGYKVHKVYLKLRNLPKEKKKLFDYLRDSSNIYWMGEFSGRWDLIFGVFTKEDYDFYKFKNELISKFNKIILEEEGDVLIEVKQYSKKYFTNGFAEPTMFAGKVEENKLDDMDHNILERLVNNARISLVELATKLKSTAIIIKNRIKKMEKSGIIIQYRIAVNIHKLNLELYKAIIKFDEYSKEKEKKFIDYISNLNEIQYLIQNMWQTELELVVGNYKQYYYIIEKLKEEFPDIIKSVDSLLMITDEWTPGFDESLK